MTGSSLYKLNNYYKNEIILRHQDEIERFKSSEREYEQLVEQSERIQKLYVFFSSSLSTNLKSDATK